MRTRKWIGLAGMVSGCALFNAPPIASFTWTPSDPMARLDVQFSDLSTDAGGLFGGGGIVSWNWDFDDGDSSTAQNPKHDYQKGGTYTVRLTVTDDAGEPTTVSRTVTVTASLDGLWNGQITNLGGAGINLILDLNHSPTGTITGTCTIGITANLAITVTYNPATREVQINVDPPIDLTLRGNLDASETVMQGDWYDNIGMQQRTWNVTL